MPKHAVKHLYIHIPFCRQRCAYCDFYSLAGAEHLGENYVDALLGELDGSRQLLAPLKTIYLGGGTPTLLRLPLMKRLLVAVRRLAGPDAELTVEANPESLTAAMAAVLGGGGVNRVSLGAQSFSPGLRQVLDRAGAPAVIPRAMAALRQAGIANIGLDLIYGIPGQSAGELRFDISEALALKAAHLSFYELSVGEGSPFARRWAESLAEARSRGREFYEMVVTSLESAGYRWYETSNFALPGCQCRHNAAYWQGEDYLGLGAGAWSTVGDRRWQNPPDMDVYIAGGEERQNRVTVESLSPEKKAVERLALGLRMDEGVSLADVASVVDTEEAARLQQNGFLGNDGDRIFLTREGRFVANEVCARLMRDRL